ncbi:hypothetical protein F66182_1631 [Fusarium sp. NRRL 66182]|nr:hypothetical protein F66182_1631 [Fusarium sp. NRRL 66182]
MNSLRLARAALRARPAAIRVPVQRRTYAEAVPDKASRAPPATVFTYDRRAILGSTLDAIRSDWSASRTARRQLMDGANCRTQSIYKSQDVVQVNIPAESGEMGVLANHVPSIEQLKPGLVEIVEESSGSKQFFLSGGFATVQPNSVLSINAVEGYPLEDFSSEAIKAQIAEAQKVANGSGSEQDIAEAKIELEVLETLSAHGQRADSGIKTRTSRDNLARQASSTLSQKERQRTRVNKDSKGQSAPERPGVSDLRSRPRASHDGTFSSRPGQPFHRSISVELLPSESLVTSHLPSTNVSRTVSSTEKCQDAMDILEQYRISRPEGWFSDNTLATPDQSRTVLSQVCHSCGNPLGFQRYCSHCGHDSCLKCTGEVPRHELGHKVLGSTEHQENSNIQKLSKPPERTAEISPSDNSHTATIAVDTAHRRETSKLTSDTEIPRTPHLIRTQSRLRVKTAKNVKNAKNAQNAPKPARKKTVAAPTTISSSVKNNYFFMADRGMKGENSEPAVTPRSVQVARKPKPSDCVPDRRLSNPPRDSHILQDECSDTECRATHAGHDPVRHSIGCVARRSLETQVVQGHDSSVVDKDQDQDDETHVQSPRKQPSPHKLQVKIDQLYHHGEDLHHAQHIMEHLAAGVKSLEPSDTTTGRESDRQDGRAWLEDHNLRVHNQPFVHHPLNKDETTPLGEDATEHSLSSDTVVPETVDSQPHNLTDDPKGDRHPSPKSREPQDGRLMKAHLVSRDRGRHVQGQGTHTSSVPSSLSVAEQTPSAKPSLPTKTPRKGLDTEAANDRTASFHNGHNVDLHSKKSVGKLNGPVAGPHMLRKSTTRIEDAQRSNAEATDISSWRTQLRKVDRSSDQPPSQQLTSSCVESWRRDLSRNRRTPIPEREKEDSCLNCHPSQSWSPKPADAAFQIVVEDESYKEPQGEQTAALDSHMPRLKVTDVEHSLARKSTEESTKTPQQEDTTPPESISTRLAGIADDPSPKETTVIHDPRPVMPYNHMCAWRARYMDLKADVDQLGAESVHQSPGKQAEGGIGASCSLPHGDIDIEGLTVVMHLRGREDLVINTDLKEDLYEHLKR